METFDYQRQIIHFNGDVFPFVTIREKETGIEHIICVSALNKKLMNHTGEYVSDQARWIDEQITYFVETEKDLYRPAEDLLFEIYD